VNIEYRKPKEANIKKKLNEIYGRWWRRCKTFERLKPKEC
jgi:hypothetical protein